MITAILQQGLTFFTDLVGDKGVDVMKMVLGELDKRRMIDYGRKQVQAEGLGDLTRELDAIHAVRQKAERDIRDKKLVTDDYRRD